MRTDIPALGVLDVVLQLGAAATGHAGDPTAAERRRAPLRVAETGAAAIPALATALQDENPVLRRRRHG